jgi:O-antigen/teichoic acid export membrane protein
MFYSYGTMLLNLVVIYLTALLFGLEVRGEVQLYLSYKIIIGSASSLGLSTGYLYFWKEKKKFISPMSILFIVGVIAGVAVLFSTGLTSDVQFDFLCVMVIIEVLNISVLELLKKDSSLNAYFKGLFLGQFITLLVFLIYVFLAFDAKNLIITYIIGGIFQLAYLLFQLYRYYGLQAIFCSSKELPPAKPSEYCYYLGGVALTAMLSTLILNFDKVFIAKYLSISELGIYSIIGSVMMIVNRFFNVVAINYFSNRINSKSALFKVNYTVFIPSMVIASILSYYLAPPILSFAISNEFRETGLVIALLLASSLLSGINAIVLQDFNVMGKPYYNIPRQIITFGVLIISLMALNFWAMNGIALAILITSIFRLTTSELLRKKITYV